MGVEGLGRCDDGERVGFVENYFVFLLSYKLM